MRPFTVLVRTTALEILSEPLTLLILLSALAVAIFTPVFHYHQFGEATRMARDAGLSSLFTGGSVLAIFSTIRSFRKEIEIGTLEMALAHPISRSAFFLAKTVGAFTAYFVVATAMFCTAVTIVYGAAIGGRIAEQNADLARIWGPCFAAGVATITLSLVLGAVLNRFARFRFVLTTLHTAVVISVLSAAVFAILSGPSILIRLVPAALLLAIPAALLIGASAAFSVRFAANGAATLSGLVFALMLPFIGNYYLAESLTRGGVIAWSYVAWAALVALPALAAFLLLGCRLMSTRESDTTAGNMA